MTIGEKITHLRNVANMSQEVLADKLSVSRQSVSKWEMDQSLPQIDKVLQICEMFNISTDELLYDKISINRSKKAEKRTLKYFGTDGFRGEANMNLTSLQAYKIGRFLGWYYASEISGNPSGHRPKIVIGKDTRRSSYMLEYSIVAGITASGADAYMLHVTTTPSVSFVTRQDEFDCGIMITASHNPFYDNGIKIINKYGEKMDDETTLLIETYLDGDLKALGITGEDLPLAHKEGIGLIVDYVSGRNRYVGYLISIASHSYRNLRIGIDCANGAAWSIAKNVFDALGAHTYIVGNQPNGLNINLDVGSTHIENLQKLIRDQHLDLGFAFDGDADRCIAVDEHGEVIDGDVMMYILAKRLKDRGGLNNNTVVTTVMSNSGFVASLKREGINCIQTKVGDRFVYERMQKEGYTLGGEPTGHIILKKYATTGDGLLTALMLTEEICDKKCTLSQAAENITLYPQHLINLQVKNKTNVMNDKALLSLVAHIEKEINGNGRVLLRESGTESVIRIMVEAPTDALSKTYADQIAEHIRNGGHCNE